MVVASDWKNWSQWIQEGHYVTYERERTRYYEYVVMRDLGHWEYTWPETISAASTSGPFVPDDLEITRGYDARNNTNQIWQMIFGIEGEVYIYIELPTDLHRHGIPKKPKPDATLREVSHFEEYMSPFLEPSFITEHIMMRPDVLQVAFSAYNPNEISITPKLNIFLAKLLTERVGTEEYGELSTPTIAGNPRLTERLKVKWGETLEKLYKHQIPSKPLTLQPVRAPAEAPSGE